MSKKFREEDEEICVYCGMEIDGTGVPDTGTTLGNTRTGFAHKNKRKCKANIAEEKAIQDFQDALQDW